ncbi:MAG: hypothetical protein P1U34_12075 [Coxiellaceae bacterium]|nr:hypothetical protein [Coxiellaceae bacterium]
MRIMTANTLTTEFNQAIQNNDLTRLKQIESGLSIKKLRSLITHNNYESFRIAAKHGHAVMLKTLKAWSTTTQFQNMISAQETYLPHHNAFSLAMLKGHLDAANKLIAWAPVDKRDDIITTAINHDTLTAIITNNNIEALRQLYEWAPPRERLHITGLLCRTTFRLAAKHSHIEILDQLHKWSTPMQIEQMIDISNNETFSEALVNPNTLIVKRLLRWATPDQRARLLSANNYQAFRVGLTSKNPRFIRMLCEFITEEQRQEMIVHITTARHSNTLTLFQLAVIHGNRRFMRQLHGWATTEEQRSSIVNAANQNARSAWYESYTWRGDYFALHLALKYKHEDITQQLFEWELNKPEHLFKAFLTAAANGDLTMLQYLMGKTTFAQRLHLLTSGETPDEQYAAFMLAAKYGHLNIMSQLCGWSTDKHWGEMLHSNNTFALTIRHNQPQVTEYIYDETPDEQKHLLFNADTPENALFYALRYGRRDIVANLRSWCTEEQFDQMAAIASSWNGDDPFDKEIQADRYERLFSIHPRSKHKDNILYTQFILNSSPHAFGYFDSCEATNLIGQQKIATWREQGKEDLDERQALFGFFILRNLIRLNDAALQPDIEFLINIPSVQKLLVNPVSDGRTPGRMNQLLMLAITTENTPAIECLLEVRAVLSAAFLQAVYTRDYDTAELFYLPASPEQRSNMTTDLLRTGLFDHHVDTALLLAAKNKDIRMLRLIYDTAHPGGLPIQRATMISASVKARGLQYLYRLAIENNYEPLVRDIYHYALTTRQEAELSVRRSFNPLLIARSVPEPNDAIIQFIIGSSPANFNYASEHSHDFDRNVAVSVNIKLSEWRSLERGSLRAKPSEPFNLSVQQAKLGVAMLGFLVSQKNPLLLDSIRFLVSIPSIKTRYDRKDEVNIASPGHSLVMV